MSVSFICYHLNLSVRDWLNIKLFKHVKICEEGLRKTKAARKVRNSVVQQFFAVLVSKLPADKGGSDNSSLIKQRAWELLLPEQKCFL